MKNKLYGVYLGGKIREKSLIEDHQLVFVVAKNEKEARLLGKSKWEAKDIHIDGTILIENVDSYDIVLHETQNGKVAQNKINNKYSK